MLVAYVLEHIIGLTIALAYFVCMRSQREELSLIIRRCLEVYHDCSVFLTFSIQVAAIVVLVKVDFGLGTDGMGDATVRVTQAVSALTLLPLLYATILLHHLGSNGGSFEHRPRPAPDQRPEENSKFFSLFVVCWLLSLYPFYSKMNSVFGPSKIGASSPNQPKPIISDREFALIEAICYQDVQIISLAENLLMTALAILAFVPPSLLASSRIILLGLRKHHTESGIQERTAAVLEGSIGRRLRQALVLSMIMIPLLACGLLWTVIRVQQFQRQMAAATHSEFSDGEWTFGQVIAVTVFVPVLVEAWFLFKKWQTEKE